MKERFENQCNCPVWEDMTTQELDDLLAQDFVANQNGFLAPEDILAMAEMINSREEDPPDRHIWIEEYSMRHIKSLPQRWCRVLLSVLVLLVGIVLYMFNTVGEQPLKICYGGQEISVPLITGTAAYKADGSVGGKVSVSTQKHTAKLYILEDDGTVLVDGERKLLPMIGLSQVLRFSFRPEPSTGYRVYIETESREGLFCRTCVCVLPAGEGREPIVPLQRTDIFRASGDYLCTLEEDIDGVLQITDDDPEHA